jgi:uroporphyrinogen decarboxylase
VVDSDGLVDELVEVMFHHGVNSFFPFEVQAGNDAAAYRRRYPSMSVWGGLDKRALAADKTAINRELDRATELFSLGGYVVGFDHAIPPDVPWENFRYFVEELKTIVGM